MTALKQHIGLAVLTFLMACVLTFIALNMSAQSALGSVSQGSEYHATTTTNGSYAAEQRLATGSGTLGSVVITGVAAGIMNFYDATTSDITARTGNTPTSTLLLASFPASAATGTYTFDRVYFNGLYTSIVGTVPTTTVTFR